MIPRYSCPEMVDIWSTQNRFQIWFEIEALICEALAKQGVIPQKAAETIREKGTVAKFDLKRIEEIEKETRHDVIAFLTHLSELIGPDSRFVHQGVTSSDILDTCFAVQLTRASSLLLKKIEKLLEVLKKRSLEHKDTLIVGRTHGIHAEPTSFGLKLAYAYAEFDRCRTRLINARNEVASCMISGAVGTFATIPPYVQDYVASKLDLRSETISTQVIPRDRHAMFFVTLGVIASCVERLATEIRHLQRTEVLEVEEYFSPGQKGSSAMPHKRNPILSENLVGLARMVRSFSFPAMENIVLWHERDISHSSVERMIGPDATITLDFALERLTNIIKNLIVYPEKMKHNLMLSGGIVYSQTILLALLEKGVSRLDAYQYVQESAMKAQKKGSSFLQEVLENQNICHFIPEETLRKKFNPDTLIQHVDFIFKKVFLE